MTIRRGSRQPEREVLTDGATASHRVLLVEDEESVRLVAERMLRKLGCEVRSAASAPEALDAVRGGCSPDVLVTDVVMPGMDGLELHRRLEEPGRRLPVVFVSGYPGVGHDRDDLTGRHVFLQKPFSGEELAGALKRALASEKEG